MNGFVSRENIHVVSVEVERVGAVVKVVDYDINIRCFFFHTGGRDPWHELVLVPFRTGEAKEWMNLWSPGGAVYESLGVIAVYS